MNIEQANQDESLSRGKRIGAIFGALLAVQAIPQDADAHTSAELITGNSTIESIETNPDLTWEEVRADLDAAIKHVNGAVLALELRLRHLNEGMAMGMENLLTLQKFAADARENYDTAVDNAWYYADFNRHALSQSWNGPEIDIEKFTAESEIAEQRGIEMLRMTNGVSLQLDLIQEMLDELQSKVSPDSDSQEI